MMEKNLKNFVTIEEAAKKNLFKEEYILKLIAEKRIPYFQDTHQAYVNPDDISELFEKWLEITKKPKRVPSLPGVRAAYHYKEDSKEEPPAEIPAEDISSS
jgi:hypothetical protein